MRHRSFAAITALCAGLSFPAYALEPDALWEQWSTWIDDQEGISVESETPTETGMVIEGIVATRDLGEGTPSTITIPALHLDAEDGSVRVNLPQGVVFDGPDGRTLEANTTDFSAVFTDATHPGLLGMLGMTAEGRITAKGTHKGTQDTEAGTGASSATVELTMDGLAVALPGGSFDGNAQATLQADSIVVSSNGKDADGEPTSLRSETHGMEGIFNLSNIQHFEGGDPIRAIAQGSDLHVSYLQERGTYAIKSASEDGWNSWDSFHLAFDLDRKGMGYTSEMTNLEAGGKLPHDKGTFGASAAQLNTSILMPLFAADTQQTATFTMLAEDAVLTGKGNAWPEALASTLASPNTASITLDATMTLDSDIWPTHRGADASTPPAVRIHTVRIQPSIVEALGGSVEVEGSMDLNGQPITNVEPGPGSALVTLTNASGVLDGLETLGLMDASQRMQADMMLRAFAAPGNPEPATYAIELLEDGTTTINDNPL